MGEIVSYHKTETIVMDYILTIIFTKKRSKTFFIYI